MFLHFVQLKVMAVGTVGCGVVDLCASNLFPVLESTIFKFAFVVLLVVVCKNRIVVIIMIKFVSSQSQTRLYYDTHLIVVAVPIHCPTH